jgi:beta-glucosidase
MKKHFPPDFVWGTATSSYQIEGALHEDGRSESIWDRFATRLGAVSDGSSGDVACDHYHRFRDDVALMADLGVTAYRFSIAWPRILPNGRGEVLHKGLDFYSDLVDALLEKGIRPFVTLNHWDMPQVLEDAGGWASRDTVSAFVAYADVVARRLGDRVKDWTTHNEPWCMAHLGYETGEHAPGTKDPSAALRAAHHLLLAHGLAVPVIRRVVPDAHVGIVLNLSPGYPASDSAADHEATRRHDGFFNRWYLDPLFRGRYPDDAIADRVQQGHLDGHHLPFVHDGDLAAIATPIDFLGINYYSRAICRGPEADNAPREIPVPGPEQVTEMGWEVFPDGLTSLLERVQRDYGPRALYVTENGASYGSQTNDPTAIDDEHRTSYVRSHLLACHTAVQRGVRLRGYFLWSFMDNFEWQFGYSRRFGIVHVDYATQVRTPKKSARFYQAAIAAGAVDDGVKA